jgi:hypothetical protein
MTLDDRHQELVDALRGDVSPEDIAARAEAIRTKLTTQLAGHIANARAAEREKLELELAEALGLGAQEAAAFGWSTLTGMVLGVRSIADVVLGQAAPDVDPGRRRDLLVSFGVADYWARVRDRATAVGPSFRQSLGLDDGPDAFRAGGLSPLEALRNDPPSTSDGETGASTDRP